eukprot:TRINITY_DN131_c0_g1_i1.p1 TRINITY_DN131_c0_g1~~TRINITY_DN131_c0_g1_i1.p1  ORF type:complete len:329 (+),score=56.61 TRINITY_DN131_c0_g1_i1:475-1461(+)
MAARYVYEEEWITNSRKKKLFTCRWLPVDQDIKSLVFLCHGYGMECSVFMKGTGIRLSEAGFAVFGIDLEGHGKSDGLRAFIDDFDSLVSDCIAFFRSVREKDEYRNKARFLFGESMGGALALLVHRRESADWNGAVLVAPMCKISDKVQPPKIVVNILTRLAPIIPTWKIVPSKDIIDNAFKDPVKRKEIRDNKLAYQEKPRLKTALEMLRVTQSLSLRLEEVTLPFLLLHGEDDRVTDPEISQELYEKSWSCDKTFNKYPGMWHGLLTGEPDDNIDLVFNDIILWLSERSPVKRGTGRTIEQSDLRALQGLQDSAGSKGDAAKVTP